MIAIVNISPDAPVDGVNKYEVRINRKVITTFEHKRKSNGLAQCLRDAADAVEMQEQRQMLKAFKVLLDRGQSKFVDQIYP